MLRRRVSLLLISAATFISYIPALFCKLTYFDDQVAIINNQSFLLKWSNLFVAFQRDTLNVFGGVGGGYYRPVGMFSMIWDAHCSGTNPFSYHLTNVILHVAVSCLLYLLLTRMSNAGNRINLTLSLLFAVHPVFVSAVTWIPGRGETQLALFILLSFYYFLPGSRNFILHQLFLLCAIFTKETALILPVVLFFYWYLYRRSPEFSRGLVIWRYGLGWVICALLFILAKHNAVGSFASGMGLKNILWSVANNFQGVFLYIGKIFLPVNLSVLPVLKDANLIIGEVVAVILCLGLAGILFYGSKLEKNTLRLDFGIVIFGLFWFLVFLLPSFVYPDLNSFPGFLEQRVYVPMIGMLFFAQQIAIALKSRLSEYKIVLSRFSLVLILVFIVMTFFRSFDFSNRMVFWRRAVKDSPHSALAHKNLGAMYYLDGNLNLAQKEFERSLELNPRETIVHNNLGLILMGTGKFAEAEEEYQKELTINPAYDNVYYNYGLLKYKEGDFEQSRKFWQKTISLNPGYIGAWQALIMLAVERKDQQEARMYLEKAKSLGLKL